MEQDGSEQMDWTVHKGRTGSSDTGPEQGADGSNDFYMYLEASGRSMGDTARYV